MSQTIHLKYNKHLSRDIEEVPGDYEKIEVEKCPSTLDAIQKINQINFKVLGKKSYAIVFKINKNFDDFETDKIHLITFDENLPLLIAFESTIDGKLIVYWKTNNMKNLLKIVFKEIKVGKHSFIPVPSSLIIDSLLIPCIKSGHNGLHPNDDPNKYLSKTVPLYCIIDSRNFNLLMISTEQNNENAVDYFLNSLIDVNYFSKTPDPCSHDMKQESAADIAFKNGNFKILLKLLKNDSAYPQGLDEFNLDTELDSEVHKFAEDILKFHNLIEEGNEKECEKFIKKYPNMHYFFNVDNQSAAYTALFNDELEIYELLARNSVHLSPFEKISFLFSNPQDKKTLKLREVHEKYALNLQNYELMMLLSKTELSLDNTNIRDPLSDIESAYRYLLDIPEVKVILQVTSLAEKVVIYQDFNRDNVLFQRAVCTGASGIFDFKTGRICIGARDISFSIQVYGTIGHEFGHCCMLVVFRNSCKPYSFGDSEAEEEFNRIVDLCKKSKDKEKIISNVYDYYTEDKWHEELIVRVPHIEIVHKSDPVKLAECRREFKELYAYYINIVVPKIEEARPFIRILSKEENPINWKELPSSLKVTCLNRKIINFQGVLVALKEIVSEELSVIVDSLDSKDIRSLINNEIINIGKALDKLDIYVERKLVGSRAKMMFNKELQKWEYNDIDITDAEKLEKTESLVLLSDEAGAGKTTTFKYLARKLKENEPNIWIIYVDLKKYLNVYEDMKEKTNDVFDILTRIQNLNEYDIKVFKVMFNLNKVVVFWDGLDEISPNYKEFMSEIIKNLNRTTNKQWISSRPQHIKHLEGMLQKSSYKLIPYSQEDRKNFITKYYTYKKQDLSRIDEIHNKIEELVVSIENLKYINHPQVLRLIATEPNSEEIQTYINSIEIGQQVNNPLMLKLITDVCTDTTFELNLMSNWYSIFDVFINKSLNIVRSKGQVVEDDRDKILKTSKYMKIHQKFALKLLFGGFYGKFNEEYPVTAPDIMEKEIDMPFAEISRLGILFVADEENFTFIHKSFAEFFAAQFLIDSLYKFEDKARDDEIKKRLKLFFHVLFDRSYNFHVVRNFIEGFISIHGTERNPSYDSRGYIFSVLQNQFKYIPEEFLACSKKEKFSKTLAISFAEIPFAVNFFANSEKIVDFIWKFSQNETLFIKAAKHSYFSNHVQKLNGICETYFTGEKLEVMLYGRHQRGNVLFNIWWWKDRSDHFYLDRYKADELTQEVRLQNSFLDFFNLVAKHLTNIELKEILLRNSTTIFNENHKSLSVLSAIWSKVEETLTEKEICEMLLTIIVDYTSLPCALHKALQMKDESCSIFMINKYRRYCKNSDIKSLILFTERKSRQEMLTDAMKNPNSSVCSEYLKLVNDAEINEIEQRKLMNRTVKKILIGAPPNLFNNNFITAMGVKNVETFHTMTAYMRNLYTDEEIRDILWDSRYVLMTNITRNADLYVFKAAIRFVAEIFANQREKFEHFLVDYQKGKNYFGEEKERLEILNETFEGNILEKMFSMFK